MSVKIVDRVGDVKIFGTGSLGGKAAMTKSTKEYRHGSMGLRALIF